MSNNNIIISNLQPPIPNSKLPLPLPIALSLKLNNNLIEDLKHGKYSKVKLIVKDGNYSLKLVSKDGSDDKIYRFRKLTEDLKVDIYSILKDSNSIYNGRIQNKLSIITDEKRIKQFNYSSATTTPNLSKVSTPVNKIEPLPTQSTYEVYKNSKIFENDLRSFLHLIALGPINKEHIKQLTNLNEDVLEKYLTTYCQVHNKNDPFTANDNYKYYESNGHILKDKSYRDLQPMKFPYEHKEENLVVVLCNNALNRLGYSQNHPLRKKIIDKEEDHHEINQSKLGGGFLSTHKKITSQPQSPAITQAQNYKRKEAFNSQPQSPAITLGHEKKESINSQPPSPTINLHKKKESITSQPQSPAPFQTHKKKESITSQPQSPAPFQTHKKKESTTSSPQSPIPEKSTTTTTTSTKRKLSNSSSNSSSALSSDEESKNKTNNYTSPPSSSEEVYEINLKHMSYYQDIAMKFKSKYKEYNELYQSLQKHHEEDKDKLVKLFEMHNVLANWKKILWDFDKESKMKNKKNIDRISPVKKRKIMLDY
ncbi:unnamed protein product [Candida verbasci]|uniref:Uncharacterized protein n=1 Tax=Candida verbasci TaxID=1227364 RepID=A0A9W4TWU2_9ASCO|nr:unnamed protein product [Candida verbasci]